MLFLHCTTLIFCSWVLFIPQNTVDAAELINPQVQVKGERSLARSQRQVYQSPFQPQLQQQQCLPVPTPVEGQSCSHSMQCDSPGTVLTCERGTCICPSRPALHWIRGPHQLNTVWEPGLKKCVSIQDSACDIYAPKIVYCQKGLICVDHGTKKKDGFGICSTSGAGGLIVVAGRQWHLSLLALTWLFQCCCWVISSRSVW